MYRTRICNQADNNLPSPSVTKVDENTIMPQLHYAHNKVANRPLKTLAAKYAYEDIMQ